MADIDVAVLLGDPRLPYAYAPDGRFGDEELTAVMRLREALQRLKGYRFRFLDDHGAWIDTLRAAPPDLALNLCDTGFRNDWLLERDVPALMEILAIPYTGADPMAISLTTDKALVRALAAGLGIPVPNESYVDLAADPLVLPTIYPCLIKPNGSGGSFGITRDCVVDDARAAEGYLRWLAGQPGVDDALLQDFLTGPEYTVGLVGNAASGFTVLPPLEVDYSALPSGLPPILTHGSKADPDSPYWEKLGFRPAQLDEVTWSQLVDHCVRLFRRLGLRDYARLDFRAGEDGMPRLLDVNTNPTWYWDGKLALMAEWAGYPYHALLRLILEASLARLGRGVGG
ncbi:D-alanine--D-alanine ligase family protein [Halomonas organivorans]|uniref:D-alanine-D-alanine ligase n=1 Tax=Halomonas organivorans TaxID=257772 RepID=A0A7W5C115_9GAMM|nr:D-alanine--D-alanine ligase [Halomonas organivorans]MBB3142672.1 D-alanine-D-alanine ligase [Halomonas organivorans]